MSRDKYVFFDIDGTLFSPRYGIPDSTREAIDLLRKNGHHPVICTGRTKVMVFSAITDLGFDGMISGVGAYGEWQGRRLFSEVLSPEEAEKLVRNFERFGFNPYPEGPEAMYYDPAFCPEPVKELNQIFSLKDPEILKPYRKGLAEISKVTAVFRDGCDETGFCQALDKKYQAVNHHNLLLETFPAGMSKGDGIRRLLSALGEDSDQTYAFGDSFNDLEMLEFVRYGVCMGNGDPKLLERIPLHAPRLEEDGLWHSLKDFGLI